MAPLHSALFIPSSFSLNVRLVSAPAVVNAGMVRQVLNEHFGYPAFREGQEPVIHAVLAGRPVLAVFPTGGGKSLCYQLPALLLDGLTLVVSPLIALMKDQVDALTRRGIAAARLDSTLDAAEFKDVDERLERGEIRILYVAPERFANEAFRRRIKQLNVALVAIDEAHCISEWGHNFRPDYLKLARICRRLKVPRVLALTATATPRVARDIRRQFRIAQADHVQLSFHRPNLDLRVTVVVAAARKPLLLERLVQQAGPAIVYVTRQETAEEIATLLQRHGHAARAYHAGLTDETRAAAQASFMAGATRIMVATIAFGMGIDKADIRSVFHYNLPKSLENYSQETGRAGRDGLPACCEMFACGDDLTVLENFIHADTPHAGALENLVDRVLRLGETFDVSRHDLAVSCDIRPAVVATALSYLELDGILEATGSFHATYRVKLVAAIDRIKAGRRPAERRLIAKLLDNAPPQRGWHEIHPSAAAEEHQCSRTTVVAVLRGLEAAGEVVLRASGVRDSYRVRQAPMDIKAVARNLAAVFAAREAADLQRLRQVLDLTTESQCLTARLTRHFGETLTERCGHCDRCRGAPPVMVKRSPARRVTDDELLVMQSLIAERHGALATPRQFAKFLCGMTSPAAKRAGLTKHPAFGLLADLPFNDVHIQTTAACGHRG